MSEQSLSSQIFTRKMLICVFTGFSSGLPLFVLLQMLPVWLTDKGLSVELIGALTGVMVPYGLKFLWAPLLDRYFPHFLGRRRSWLLISQVVLLISLYAISQFDPVAELSTVAKIATFIAFFSATQDIVLDAYRREILTDNELGLGNTIHINAYRVAGLIPGGLSLYLATIYPWETVFLLTALCMLAGIFMTLFLAKEPQIAQVDRDQPFYMVFWIPLKEFFQRKGVAQAIGFLLFLFLYKFGDSFATTLQTKFVYDMGFEKEHIALVVKSTSLWASISAGLVGGVIMLRLGINRALWVFGFIQLITIGGFIWLAAFGHFDQIGAAELWKLGFVIAGEYIGVGLGTQVGQTSGAHGLGRRGRPGGTQRRHDSRECDGFRTQTEGGDHLHDHRRHGAQCGWRRSGGGADPPARPAALPGGGWGGGRHPRGPTRAAAGGAGPAGAPAAPSSSPPPPGPSVWAEKLPLTIQFPPSLIADTPILKAKNACPKAVSIVPGFKYDQSGFNKNATPSIAPGKVSERIASAIKRINKPGINTRFAFSMPSETPPLTTQMVISMNKP